MLYMDIHSEYCLANITLTFKGKGWAKVLRFRNKWSLFNQILKVL